MWLALTLNFRTCHERATRVDNETLSHSDQDVIVMKWAILWRSLILSTLGDTMYPYGRHLRMLDLRDLSNLLDELEESKRGKVVKYFFAGKMTQFHFLLPTTTKKGVTRLDRNKIVMAVGDEVTKMAPLLEGLSEPSTLDTLSAGLPDWAPRLSHLHELELWDGKALGNETVRNLLRAHCPQLSQIRMHHCSNNDADNQLAALINGLPSDTLTHFENLSSSGIGAETCLALSGHGKSLVQLKLALDHDGVLALAHLQRCTNLETLDVTGLRQSVDLKATENDVYVQIIEWLRGCHKLREVNFENVLSAPDLLLPVLQNKDVHLLKLQVTGNDTSMYVVKDHHDFHRALALQTGLESLQLYADPDPTSRDDIEVLTDTFCSLKSLRELRLTRLSDYFSDQHIALLAHQLPKLEVLNIGGYGISDSVLDDLLVLSHLKSITFSGVTSFTTQGLLNFIDGLSDGNVGLTLVIWMADQDSAISDQNQGLIRSALSAKADGRFEYQLLRGEPIHSVASLRHSYDYSATDEQQIPRTNMNKATVIELKYTHRTL